jgi:hypothetical protein
MKIVYVSILVIALKEVCALRRFSLLLVLLTFCPGAAGGEVPWNPHEFSTDNPMRIVVVRSSKPGCEPRCAEWIAAEGDIVLASAELLRKVINSLNGRKLPILIHSGGGIINQAMLMGFLIRARGLDVAVARTVFDPCASTPSGCKRGMWSGLLGEPDQQPAFCGTSCTFVLAGGVRRFIGPETWVEVQNFRLTPAIVERWQQTYRGTTPVDSVIQRSFVPPIAAQDRTYFRKLGVSENIVDLMVSMPQDETRRLAETELLKLRVATEIKDGHEVVYGYKGSSDHAIADHAIADHSNAIEIDPKYAHAYNNRGYAYRKKGDPNRAITDIDKAIALDPKNAPAYNNRAMAYFAAGKPAQGLPDVEKALELHPDDPEALDTRGLIFEALGRKQEAIADFRRALALAPDLQSSKDALKRLGALGTP